MSYAIRVSPCRMYKRPLAIVGWAQCSSVPSETANWLTGSKALEFGIGLHQIHCAVPCIDVQHAVGRDNYTHLNFRGVPHNFACFPIQTDQALVAALGGPVDAAVEQDNAVHLGIKRLVRPCRFHAHAVFCQSQLHTAIIKENIEKSAIRFIL